MDMGLIPHEAIAGTKVCLKAGAVPAVLCLHRRLKGRTTRRHNVHAYNPVRGESVRGKLMIGTVWNVNHISN